MPSIEKCLEMLTSSNADKRYEACEWLRVSPKSSQQVIAALEKALQDNVPYVADAAKKALDSEANIEMLKVLGRLSPSTEEELQKVKKAQDVASILIVTTPNIENYTVKDYLSLISSQVVLGTGFLSELMLSLQTFLVRELENSRINSKKPMMLR